MTIGYTHLNYNSVKSLAVELLKLYWVYQSDGLSMTLREIRADQMQPKQK